MRHNIFLLLLFYFALSCMLAFSQKGVSNEAVSSKKEIHDADLKHSIGSSLYLLGNLMYKEPVYDLHLTYGYRLTKKDVLIVEGMTWTYFEPLGANGSSNKQYPGKLRVYGIGAGYQRSLWKNLSSTLYATPLLTQYYDSDYKKIQRGFQLYLRALLGYRFEFSKHHWYLEPSVEFNFWPVNTNLPESFRAIEKDLPNYSLLSPNLYFGYRFW